MPAMPSPTDDTLCLRCATPLTKPDDQRAIDDVLGLDPHGVADETPMSFSGMDANDDFTSESFSSHEEPVTADREENAPLVDGDEWDFDITTSAETRRLLGMPGRAGDLSDQTPANEPFASLLPAAESVLSQSRAVSANHQSKEHNSRSESFLVSAKSFAAWSAICIGLMAFACGGVLLGWSVLGERSELWSLGVPITLVGQVALLVGLCLQLDRLWSENRDTSERLGQLDVQLDDLRQSTRLLGTPYHSASQNFYAHLSEGASPKMLLTDLKGQIDLLTLRMSQQENRR